MLINPYVFADDAARYIAAVEAADGQSLESGVKDAIVAFVNGCKADGIWTAIKASCILAGARTLSGALVPLVGAVPTAFNFVSGDYNRKTGLIGDGSSKYLSANRNNNIDPQNNRHLSVYASSLDPALSGPYIGTVNASGNSVIANSGTSGSMGIRIASAAGLNYSAIYGAGFLGAARPSSGTVNARGNQTSVSSSQSSSTLANAPINVFLAIGRYSNGRIAFYSIGESLDLVLLDSRVTTLINAIAAAIP